MVDDGSPVDVIYLDFQKAFDKVPHQRLILKLKSHGMGNSIVNWIEQKTNTQVKITWYGKQYSQLDRTMAN